MKIHSIGDRLLVSLVQEPETSVHSSLFPKQVFEAVEIKVLEYSMDEKWVKVELAETRECCWWKVEDFPPFLAYLASVNDEDSFNSPLQQFLVGKRERAFAEFTLTTNQSRQRVIAVIETPMASFRKDEVFVTCGQLAIRPDILTQRLQAFTERLEQKGISEMKIAGAYPEISP